MSIECIRSLVGREGRENLFAVHVMRKESEAGAEADGSIEGSDRTRRAALLGAELSVPDSPHGALCISLYD